MEKEETKTEVKNIIKINKLKISKLFYEMNPLRDPKERLKIAEDLFLNNCIQNNLQKEKQSLSERKKFPKLNIKNLKYIYDYTNRNIPTINKKNNHFAKNLSQNFLITSLKLPISNIKYRKIKIINKINKNSFKIDRQLEKRIKPKINLNKIESNFNKYNCEDFENENLKDIFNKNEKISLNILNNNFSYESSDNNIIRNNNYDIKKYYRSNMVLPKITKKYIKPLFENNKSKEIKDLFSLKQYQIKEIEEKIKTKPFIY